MAIITPKTSGGDAGRPSLKLEKNAGLIMGTNNSSIVSKRSVERLYHPEPHFFRYFVRKPLRRSPTINRGYWLRMRAVDHVVRQFLEQPSHKAKLVVNLGCGYDPLPFQWLCQKPDLCRNTRFIDVDYKELMESKRDIVLATPQLMAPLAVRKLPEPGQVLLHSDEYVGIGCDMRDTDALDKAMRPIADAQDCLVLFVAEVSLTYMSYSTADALIKWAASLSDDVKFCLLEQYLPDGADHPFAETMLKHFDKLQTPLRSISQYPSLHSQTQRFFSAGYEVVKVKNLWELWSDPHFLSPSQRLALDKVEPFDEWEEFALFASHYFLLTAQVESNTSPKNRRDSPLSDSGLSTRTTSPGDRENHRCNLKYFENPHGKGRTHHGATFVDLATGSVAVHGGAGVQTRRGSTDIYGSWKDASTTLRIPTDAIAPRSCHTITTLDTSQTLLIGGRASPAAVMQDCWSRAGADWEKIQDLPFPRYRHAAAPVRLLGGSQGIVIFGGKNASSSVYAGFIMWHSRSGWQILPNLNCQPTPRFGASAVSLGDTYGLYFGGMRQDGVILEDFWRWQLLFRDGEVMGIHLELLFDLEVSSGLCPYMGRFSATANPTERGVLVTGGIARCGCIPKHYEIMSVSETAAVSTNLEAKTHGDLSFSTRLTHHHGPRPLLVGHSSASVEEGVLLVGGGAVCFSFGTFWNKGAWLLHDATKVARKDWTLLNVEAAAVSSVSSEPAKSTIESEDMPKVERVRISSAEDFANLVQCAEPKILDGLDFGPCVRLWNVEYLRDKIGVDRQVVVHHAQSSNMNFQKKDFKYVTQKFGEFVEELEKGLPRYLRSISSEKPAQKPAMFAEDFPEIAQDFHLPPEMALVGERFHSSPLRISNGVTMWLHYDTSQNVLFQIGGYKKMVLFSPVDMSHLDIPPGATTSRLEVFDGLGRAQRVRRIPGTHPVEAMLRRGDVLFIPPLWAHTGAPQGGVNVALNVFFRNLDAGAYASGRDVYGNRDLQAYEQGRTDLEKIVRRFDGRIPRDVSKAYLSRLADELRVKAAGL